MSVSLLDRFVMNAEKITLDDKAILKICNNQVNIIPYSSLTQYTDIFQFLGTYSASIIFYEVSSKYDGHWVCLLFHRDTKTIELWDSYGMNDEQILDRAHTSEALVNERPILTELIHNACIKYGLKYVYNNHRFQSNNMKIATCGRYASLRARFKEFSLSKFNRLLIDNLNPDYIVSCLTVMFSDEANNYV